MILSDHEIKALIGGGMVENTLPELINPASLDLRLGSTVMIESCESFDLVPVDISKYTEDEPFWLKPNEFVLAETMEKFNLPENVALTFFLKSSRAREGYEHAHAGYGDPGWHNSVLTLELKNNRQLWPLPLWPGLKIGQAVFHMMSKVPDTSYAIVGHFNNDATVQNSRGYL